MGRLVVQSDINAYNAAIVADGRIPMQLNDVIFPYADRNANNNHFDRTAWTGARLGASIWIEVGAAPYNAVDIGTQTAGSVTVPTNASNPCHIYFFNGQGGTLRQNGTIGAADVQIYNIDHIIFDQETNTYPGLRDGWGSGRTGTFGMRVKHNFLMKSGMAIKIDHTGGTMKTLEIRGCELTVGSFAKIRSVLAENNIEKMLIERNLITRSVGGEGLYIGQTSRLSGDDWNTIVFTVRDNIFAFTAAEGLQLQQMSSNSRVHNNVLFITGHDFKAAFQPFQDTGCQLNHIQGNTRFYNNIVYGHGTTGIHVFGINGADNTPDVLWGNVGVKIYNNCVGGAKKGVAIRVHDSFDYGPGVIFRDNDIIDPQRNYLEVGDLSNYYFDVPDNVAPTYFIGGNVTNDANPVYLNSASNSLKASFNINRANIATPQFVNSGFDGIDVHKITKWSEVYQVGWHWVFTENNPPPPENAVDPSLLTNGGSVTMITANDAETGVALTTGHNVKVFYRPGGKQFYGTVQSYVNNTIVINNISNRVGSGAADPSSIWDIFRMRTHTAGEFVWLAEDGEVMPMNLYKCLVTHEGVPGNPLTRRPDNDPTRWQLVQWDANGKNIYDPLYNGTPVTTDFMEVAGDFRLVKGSYHHLKGRGLSCNEQRDDQTMMGWQWRESPTGPIRDIPGAYDIKLTIADYSYLRSGRQYRYWVQMRNATGFEPKVFSTWQTVP